MATTIQARVMGIGLLFFFHLSASSMAQFDTCLGKNSWPELVGEDGSTVEDIIKAENPYVKIVDIVLEGSPVTLDFRCDRVRVWVNSNNTIYLTPKVG